MMRWARRAWGRATALAGTRQGAAILVAASLVVFVIQSLGWPTAPGRDLESYLAVYVDFWHSDAVFPWEMLSRVPVAPLVVGGLLDTGSPFLVETVSALLFAGSILLYAKTALLFGRGPAVLVGAALVLYPGYGVVFHELASEIVFAAGFAVWVAVVVRAALFPSGRWFAAAGAATGLIALTRPANQVFLVVAILPLLLPGSWRARVGRTAAFAGVAIALLGAWAATNLWRYDDLAVSRGGQANLPFFRVFIVDHTVRPENGPASRELAAAVERDLLTKEPYRSYGIDIDDVLLPGQPERARGPHQPLRSALGVGLRLQDARPRRARGGARAPRNVRPQCARRLLEGALEAPLRRSRGPYVRQSRRRARGPRRDGRRRRARASRPDRGRADSLRVPERADVDARHEHP